MIVDGLEYVTTGQACARLAPDVGRETLRNWYAPRKGPPRVRVLRDLDGRPVKLNGEVVVCWPDVVEAEHATRQRARRPRG